MVFLALPIEPFYFYSFEYTHSNLWIVAIQGEDSVFDEIRITLSGGGWGLTPYPQYFVYIHIGYDNTLLIWIWIRVNLKTRFTFTPYSLLSTLLLHHS